MRHFNVAKLKLVIKKDFLPPTKIHQH